MTGWVYDDGGRRLAGFRGEAGDCVPRALAIATGAPYAEVYRAMADGMARLKPRRGQPARGARTARNGVARSVYEPWLFDRGWVWCPTMSIGSGTRVHLTADELPEDPVICRVSKHLVAVVDGVIRDTHDPSRGGRRAVYGWYQPGAPR